MTGWLYLPGLVEAELLMGSSLVRLLGSPPCFGSLCCMCCSSALCALMSSFDSSWFCWSPSCFAGVMSGNLRGAGWWNYWGKVATAA